nr:hypothetical protein [Ectobacillus panaciterrae]
MERINYHVRRNLLTYSVVQRLFRAAWMANGYFEKTIQDATDCIIPKN